MIKTSNLNKYFNKGKSNEIHVINQTSIEFPEKGLVTLVGSSGSGKTTLLNVISGLDSTSGEIKFDDKTIKKYHSSTWDKIRAHDVGFVFQNYYLLEDRSVLDNIKITLNMIGIVDEEEVEYRSHYVLDAVGMFRFRNKRASDLSGGQKQRVAIARAIAKNPKVVIADEPTGNLDSKNSNDVMRIIKKISEERLVVLVTHEKNLAYAYSDQIISLADGKVVGSESNVVTKGSSRDFDDKNIYLGNLNKHKEDENTVIYSNNIDNDVQVRIIKINNQYYIDSPEENVRFNVITPKSGIKVFDDTKENIEKSGEFETDFSLDELDEVKSKRIKKRTFSFKDAFIDAIRKVTNLGRKSRIQIIALIMLGIMFSVSIHMLFSSLFFDESQIKTDPNIYEVTRIVDYNDISSLNDENIIIYPNIEYNNLFVDYNSNSPGNYNLPFQDYLPLEVINEDDIIMGRYPSNYNEIVVDISVVSSSNPNYYNFKMIGLYNAEQLLNERIYFRDFNYDIPFEIVGITNSGNMSLYLKNDVLISSSVSNGYLLGLPYALSSLDADLVVEGRLPIYNENETGAFGYRYLEVIINEKHKSKYPIFDSDNPEDSTRVLRWMNNYEIRVVGYYESDDEFLVMKLDEQTHAELSNEAYALSGNVYAYAINDIDTSLSKYEGFRNLREVEVTQAKNAQRAALASSLTQMIISIAVSGLIFYFLVRSSITSRVKEISILRSLGVGKYEVVSSYSLEYTLLTAATSLIGVLIGAVVTSAIASSFLSGFLTLRVTGLSFITSVVGIFVTNVLIALIPLILLLRKTPAQMLTNYDI